MLQPEASNTTGLLTFYNDVSLAPPSIVDAFDDVEDKLHAFDMPFTEPADKQTEGLHR